MGNRKDTLADAHALFSNKEYDKALFLYSQVISLDPTNIEYQIYCILCDLAYDNDAKAQQLFEYFIVTKDINFDESVKYVQDIVNAFDGDNNKMMNLLKDISNTSVESLNAIEYKDFMNLVDSRGSFKEAYQDIMFSTKVAITTKKDLIDFIDQLIENNFNKTAYSYLDGFNEFFTYDQELTDLYEKLGRKDSDNK
ncbi:MAG: tetratricopeptide repeat protein [Campylobacterota bacterium]|nr:tetratricopeptide repeat protein [Campylobacterota bacterium]